MFYWSKYIDLGVSSKLTREESKINYIYTYIPIVYIYTITEKSINSDTDISIINIYQIKHTIICI